MKHHVATILHHLFVGLFWLWPISYIIAKVAGRLNIQWLVAWSVTYFIVASVLSVGAALYLIYRWTETNSQ